MCGRFGISKDKDFLKKRFRLSEIDLDYKSSFNIAPSQNIPVILNTNPSRLHLIKWGYVPHWMKKDKPIITINARAEHVHEKNFFKNSFAQRRCLILADGFYEWAREGARKQPYRVFLKGEECFALAGIWDVFDEQMVCAIITTQANDLVKKIHDRMPVILDPQNEMKWLESTGLQEVTAMLKSYDPMMMDMHKIGIKVNAPENNTSDIINKI